GGGPLAPEHGGPARKPLPPLYFLKRGKWVRGLRLQAEEEPGVLGTNGYKKYGDPWKEQRHWGGRTGRLQEVAETVPQIQGVKTLALDVPDWPGHRTGQHLDVRLTAEDGYQVERSYSIASAPTGTRVDITVERLDDGEVSPYLTDELRSGDKLELRGPVGGYFVWEPAIGGPGLLRGGGAGVGPLAAVVPERAAARGGGGLRLLPPLPRSRH